MSGLCGNASSIVGTYTLNDKLVKVRLKDVAEKSVKIKWQASGTISCITMFGTDTENRASYLGKRSYVPGVFS